MYELQAVALIGEVLEQLLIINHTTHCLFITT